MALLQDSSDEDELRARINELFSSITPPQAKDKSWLDKMIEQTQVGFANQLAEKFHGQFLYTESHGWRAWTGCYWPINKNRIKQAIEVVLFERIEGCRKQLEEA